MTKAIAEEVAMGGEGTSDLSTPDGRAQSPADQVGDPQHDDMADIAKPPPAMPLAGVPINRYGNVDIRSGIPQGWVRLERRPDKRHELEEAGISVAPALVGFRKKWVRWEAELSGYVIEAGWEEILSRYRATPEYQAEVAEKQAAEAARRVRQTERRRETAQKAAETRRKKKALNATPYGRLIAALSDAQACSDLAKSRTANGVHFDDYTSGRYRRANYRRSREAREIDYEKKEDAVRRACIAADEAGIIYGWKAESGRIPWVVYFSLPTGQVSFHSTRRGEGPDYRGSWDGQEGETPKRIAAEVSRLSQR
jgi:hypothetical protein